MTAQTDPRFHAPSAEEMKRRESHIIAESKSMLELIALRAEVERLRALVADHASDAPQAWLVRPTERFAHLPTEVVFEEPDCSCQDFCTVQPIYFAPPLTPDLAGERERFEEWYLRDVPDEFKDRQRYLLSLETEPSDLPSTYKVGWEAWQAALASRLKVSAADTGAQS